MANDNHIVILMSGGLDSTVVAAHYVQKGFKVRGLTVFYGQRHDKEIQLCVNICKQLGIMHHVTSISNPSYIFSSALTTAGIPIEDPSSLKEITQRVPSTFVPGRNLVFLSLATAFAAARGICNIGIGANALDFSGYPDCRPEFIEAFQQAARLALGDSDFTVQAPLIKMTKKQIVELGLMADAPFDLTWSCYKGEGRPCLTCDSCVLRTKGFMEANVPDPILTKEEWEAAVVHVKSLQ